MSRDNSIGAVPVDAKASEMSNAIPRDMMAPM